MKHPLIGITLDVEPPKPGGYSSERDWYAMRTNYCSAVSRAGGIPMPLPHEPVYVEEYLARIDGLVITGGFFDVDPAMYGQQEVHKTVTTKDTRTAFEAAIVKGALKKNIPILGICGGMQLINVLCGGTLLQHIPDSIKDALEHEQKTPHDEPCHPILIDKESILFDIFRVEHLAVNSSHHQAVGKPGKNLMVSATAPDGVIEAIEHTEHPFCIGVEWHPEYLINAEEEKLFEAFIRACMK